MGVSGQHHASAALLPLGKGPPVPIVQEAGWAPEPVWTQRLEEKSSASAGHRTPITRSSSTGKEVGLKKTQNFSQDYRVAGFTLLVLYLIYPVDRRSVVPWVGWKECPLQLPGTNVRLSAEGQSLDLLSYTGSSSIWECYNTYRAWLHHYN
jgi:hypothetical protein